MSTDNDDEIELSNKMNYCVVPEFEMNDDYPNIPSGIFTTSKNSRIADEGIMELIWQNGQVILQSQNQRCMKKSYLCSDQSGAASEEESVAASAPLYMQEDEMASWLQSPLHDSSFEHDLCTDFLYTSPSCTAVTSAPVTSTAEISSPLPLLQTSVETIAELRCTNEAISRNEASCSGYSVKASTVVESNDTVIAAMPDYMTSPVSGNVTPVSSVKAAAPPGEIHTSTAEICTISSSPQPIIPQLRCTEGELTHPLQKFEHFSRLPDVAILQNGTSSSCHSVRASTVVESNETVEIRPPLSQQSVETITSSPQLIMPQLRCTEGELTHQLQNFGHFSRLPDEAILRNGASSSGHSVKASTVVESNDTVSPAMPEYMDSRVSGSVTPVSSVKAAAPLTLSQPSEETIASSPRLIIPQLRSTDVELPHRLQNFENFSRLSNEAILLNGTSSSGHLVRASTVVESNDTVKHIVSRVSDNVMPASALKGREITAAKGGGREVTTGCELTLTSSTSGSGGSVSASPEPQQPSHAAADDRKRKGREPDDYEGQSEDVEFESADAKKQVRSSTSAKRSRAAEVHNLSERKRRDRINEKMRALQELIPRCNKSDKASMLEEAIEYLKSLQLQVQMMSTGCRMVPMMYPGIPQYMPTMGMNMGMNRPMVPYPQLMPGPTMQNAAVAAQMAPQYPLPRYHLPPCPAPDPSRIQVANQSNSPRLNLLVGHNMNQQPRLPNFRDPYQQYFWSPAGTTDVTPESGSGTTQRQ